MDKNEKTLISINEDSMKVFNKFNIIIPEKYKFSDINIVIGQNGCGKTRFLNAIKEIFKNKDENNIIYGYFPNLSPSKNKIKNRKELPIATLYESLIANKIEFDDFFNEIEKHNEDYIIDLLNYHSLSQKKRGEKVFKVLKETYFTLSENKLDVINKNKKFEIYVENENGEKNKLKSVIKLFSPGELMIFYMSIFMSFQKESTHKRVIILDEPECHLHPKALINFINILKKSNYFKSIWIATHSLFIIPEFDFNNIIFIKNSNVIERRGSLYNAIFKDLLGEENFHISQFMSSVNQWQYAEFLAECFIDPGVIDVVDSNDEQVLAFIEFLKQFPSMRILDYGGGSARLGLSLKASEKFDANFIDYEIYDIDPKYSGNEFIVHKSFDTINKKYDCVVMMNVLHEIDPEQWINVFNNISKIIKDNSYVFFVETSILSKGEMPNNIGYLILGEEELNILFNCGKKLKKVVIKEIKKSVCIPIQSDFLKNISKESIYKTIQHLEKSTLEKIKKERINNDIKSSRYYAYLTQLYINAKLFNDEQKLKNKTNYSQIKKLIENKFGSIKYEVIIDLAIVMIKEKITVNVPKIYLRSYFLLLDKYAKTKKLENSDLEFLYEQIKKIDLLDNDGKLVSLLLIFIDLIEGENRIKEKYILKYSRCIDLCLDKMYNILTIKKCN